MVIYLAAYWTNPGLPGSSPQNPRGWWVGFDQGQYYKSVVALHHGNYTPAEHFYPLGYPLIGALFYPFMPRHPFLIPDLGCGILLCLAFVDICRRLVPFAAALVLCGLGVFLTPNVLSSLIPPWTNIPAAAAFMSLAALALRPRLERRQLLAGGVCAGVIFAVRPGDLCFALPLVAALWLGCAGWREGLRRGAWFALGAAPVAAVMLYYSILIHGQIFSKGYLHANAGIIGSGLASWGLKLYTFFIDGFVLFGEPRTLATVFPLIFLLLPGLLVFVRLQKWRAIAVVLAQLGTVVYFLAFNDYWISNAFKFGGIRYWLWLLPFPWLYAYLTVTRAWRDLGLIVTGALIVAPLALWALVRMDIRPVFTASPSAVNSSAAWSCVPDPGGSCTISMDLAAPVSFDILKLQAAPPPNLLYAEAFVDGRLSRAFHDYFLSAAGDGQPLLLFYRRQYGHSIRLKLHPAYAAATSVRAVWLYRRNWTLGLRSSEPGDRLR